MPAHGRMLVTGTLTREAIRAMDHEGRKDPENLVGRVPESKKGHLKVYLGGAAGVGKTYRMLEEAQQLREQGHDVVLGFVEAHGRAETAADDAFSLTEILPEFGAGRV